MPPQKLLLPAGGDYGDYGDAHGGEDDEADADDADKGPTMGSELNRPQNGAFFSSPSAS